MSQKSTTGKKTTIRNPTNQVCRIWQKIFRFAPQNKGDSLNDSEYSDYSCGLPIALIFVMLCAIAGGIACGFYQPDEEGLILISTECTTVAQLKEQADYLKSMIDAAVIESESCLPAR